MSIYARVMGLEEPRISGHVLIGVIAEYARGKITGTQAKNFLGLDAAEVTQAAELKDRVTGGQLTANEIENVFAIVQFHYEANNPYSSESALKTRLGVTS